MQTLQTSNRCGWSSHDFVVFYLQTTPTKEVLDSNRSFYRRRDDDRRVVLYVSWAQTPASWYRGGVDQSPITDDALISIDVDQPWWRRSHESFSDFTSTGPIFSLVQLLSCIMTCSSPYSLSIKPPLLWLKIQL